MCGVAFFGAFQMETQPDPQHPRRSTAGFYRRYRRAQSLYRDSRQTIQHTPLHDRCQEDRVGTHDLGASRKSVPVRLATMMFLQYFALGAWIVPLTRYLQTLPAGGGLGFSPSQASFVYMTFAFGALVAPPVIGLLADRWFAVDRVIAATNAAMAVLMGAAAWWCDRHDGIDALPPPLSARSS
jgi:hypothetical protein